MNFVHRLLCRVTTPEEINGADRCPTYMYRWVLLSTRWFKVYIHRFVGDDWSRDLHDHPKRFVTVGLWGRYLEHGPAGRRRLWRAPFFRTFPAAHVHRITLPAGEAWTLVVVGQTEREWGFWHLEDDATGDRGGSNWRWIHWRTYVEKGNRIADERKACS